MTFEGPRKTDPAPAPEAFNGHLRPATQLEVGMHSIDHDKKIVAINDLAGAYRINFAGGSSITLDRDDALLVRDSA